MIAILMHIVSLRVAEEIPSVLPKSVAITAAHRMRVRQLSGQRRGWNFKPGYAKGLEKEVKKAGLVMPWEKNRRQG